MPTAATTIVVPEPGRPSTCNSARTRTAVIPKAAPSPAASNNARGRPVHTCAAPVTNPAKTTVHTTTAAPPPRPDTDVVVVPGRTFSRTTKAPNTPSAAARS